MARTIKQGATWPPLRGEAADSTGTAVDLSTAQELEVHCIGPTHTIIGPATALQPPVPDADGVHFWNWEYGFVAGDTDIVGSYNVYLKCTWAPGEIEWFPDSGSEKLTIEAVN